MMTLHAMGGVPPGWKLTPPTGDVANGRQLFVEFGCASCHRVEGEAFSAKPADGVGPELTGMGVPSGFKYVRSEEDRKAVELVVSQQVFLRSYIAPPEIPKKLLEQLRAGFDATMKDPQFLEDTAKLRIDISPLPGSKVQDVVAKLYASPKDVVMRARQIIAP